MPAKPRSPSTQGIIFHDPRVASNCEENSGAVFHPRPALEMAGHEWPGWLVGVAGISNMLPSSSQPACLQNGFPPPPDSTRNKQLVCPWPLSSSPPGDSEAALRKGGWGRCRWGNYRMLHRWCTEQAAIGAELNLRE